MKIYYANTKKQNLLLHSQLIGELSVKIFQNIINKNHYEKLIQITKNEEKYSYENLEKILYYSGLFHDIGKIEDGFQDFVNLNINEEDVVNDKKTKGFFNENIRHNEISYFIIFNLFKYYNDDLFNLEIINEEFKLNNGNFNDRKNSYIAKTIKYLVLWHHSKVLRVEHSINTYKNIYDKLDANNKILNLTNNIKQYLNINDFEFTNDDNEDLPEFKYWLTNNFFDKKDDNYLNNNFNLTLNNVKLNVIFESIKTLLRSILIEADWYVSSLNPEDLNDFEFCIQNYFKQKELKNNNSNNSLLNAINLMTENFNKISTLGLNVNRNNEQNKVAIKLNENSNEIKVLQGPAGCGKTKIMFDFIKHNKSFNTNKKVFIICPRQVICESLFNELTSSSYFLEAKDLKIELFNSSEHKIFLNKKTNDYDNSHRNNSLKSDINITTIDQIVSLINSHHRMNVFTDLMSGYLIVDEYHELFDLHNLVFIFKELLLIKQMMNETNTLLVSATPNYFFTKKILDIDEKNIKKIKSFNEKIINVNLIESDYLHFENSKNGEIYIYNTAINSQLNTISLLNDRKNKGLNVINFHSKLNDDDRKLSFDKIMKNFKKDNFTREFNIQSGPLLQASVNISTDNMFTEISSPENLLQRIGRLNRFGEFENNKSKINIYYSSFLDKKSNINIMLSKNNIYEQSVNFIKYLINHFKSTSFSLTLNEFYEIYSLYSNDINNEKYYLNDYQKNIKEIAKIFKNVENIEPIQLYKHNNVNKQNKLISKDTLRGSSIFINVLIKKDNKIVGYMEKPKSIKLSDIKLDKNKDESDLLIESFSLFQEMSKKESYFNNLLLNDYSDIFSTFNRLKKFSNKQKISFFLKNIIKNSETPLYISFKNEKFNSQMYYIILNDTPIGLMNDIDINKGH